MRLLIRPFGARLQTEGLLMRQDWEGRRPVALSHEVAPRDA